MQQTTPWLPIGTFIGGFVINEGLHRMREIRAAKKERKAVATSLFVEVYKQAEQAMVTCDVYNRFGYDENGEFRGAIKQFQAQNNRPLPLTMYKALATRIHRLGAKPAAAVISFYQNLETLTEYINGLPKGEDLHGMSPELNRMQTNALTIQWQVACWEALRAINAIEPIAEPNAVQPVRITSDKFKEYLGRISNGEVLELYRKFPHPRTQRPIAGEQK